MAEWAQPTSTNLLKVNTYSNIGSIYKVDNSVVGHGISVVTNKWIPASLLAKPRHLQLYRLHSISNCVNQNGLDAKSQHQLPLARIKKIVKSNEEVKMISANTLILCGKACEMFTLKLTLRASQKQRNRDAL